VTVDARLLDGPLGGSQIHTLALIEALATAPGLRLRVLLGPEVRHDARTALARLELDTLTYDEAIRGVPRSDVVHRPMQVFTHSDMALLRLLGERIVVTYHDGILFHNRDYFASETLWRSYRRTTSQALAEADRVVFSTRHARDEALRDELVTPQRAAVLALGTDHHVPRDEGTAPAAMPADEAPFLLCLGSDLRHKNRPFAIRLARALRKLGWSGRLVLAGARAAHGSSAARERKLLADWPGAADTVVTLDHVSEAEREWLMSRCAAVVFASVSEGFGLPPFEAARRGVPCLFAPRSAMAELLPLAASTIVPWDAEASAQGALAVLADTAQRARHLELLRDAAQPLTWRHFADGLIGVYEAAARSPRRAVSALVAQADERERDLRALDELTIDLRARIAAIGPDAMRLVGPDGLLPPDIQRALLAAVARRPGRAGLFALLRAGYRFGHRGQ
jgi:glycosyltransferase involved in cell wall biosynthesis